jgi:ribosomal protein S18 acetylase RimI-like enzyme
MSIVREPKITRETHIRSATSFEVAAVAQIVANSYSCYIPRMGRTPAPMLDDYAVRIQEGSVWVIEEGNTVRGIAVLVPKHGHMLLENIAVDPAYQETGLGRLLLMFAEAEAMRQGYSEICLYTHKTMTENRRLYRKIGYAEAGCGTETAYGRVFMRKQLNANGAR